MKIHLILPIVASLVCNLESKSINPLIIGGEEVEQGEFNFLVAVLVKNQFKCAGNLVQDNVVITTASCLRESNAPVQAEDVEVVAGAHDLTDDQESMRQPRKASLIKIHENYNPNTKENDIAGIVLDYPVIPGDDVGLVKLPEETPPTTGEPTTAAPTTSEPPTEETAPTEPEITPTEPETTPTEPETTPTEPETTPTEPETTPTEPETTPTEPETTPTEPETTPTEPETTPTEPETTPTEPETTPTEPETTPTEPETTPTEPETTPTEPETTPTEPETTPTEPETTPTEPETTPTEPETTPTEPETTPTEPETTPTEPETTPTVPETTPTEPETTSTDAPEEEEGSHGRQRRHANLEIDGVVVGWGIYEKNEEGKPIGGNSPTPKKLHVTRKEDQTGCKTKYGSKFKESINFCAGAANSALCNNDEGGPFFVEGVLQGIVIDHKDCAIDGVGALYANVAAYAGWIENILEENPSSTTTTTPGTTTDEETTTETSTPESTPDGSDHLRLNFSLFLCIIPLILVNY